MLDSKSVRVALELASFDEVKAMIYGAIGITESSACSFASVKARRRTSLTDPPFHRRKPVHLIHLWHGFDFGTTMCEDVRVKGTAVDRHLPVLPNTEPTGGGSFGTIILCEI